MWKVHEAMGKFFLVAGFLPALAFIAACDLLILSPVLGGQRLVDIEFLEKGVVYVVGGLFLGLLLMALNTPIIKLYENGLVVSGWLKRRNQRRHEQRYAALSARRTAYRQTLESGQKTLEAGFDPELEEIIAKLEGVHEAIENKYGSRQRLPHDSAAVMPTALGNAFAVIEEYAYERYGMEAMVYWPRMAAVIPQDYASQIADLKTTLDLILNLSLLAGLFGLGALGFGVMTYTTQEIAYGLAALVITYSLYRLAIGTTWELGELVMSCFDLFRGQLLAQYGLPKPSSLVAERRLWLLLAGFIRRGEDFYYPLEPEAVDDGAMLQQELGRHTYSLSKLRQLAAVYAAGKIPLYLLHLIEAEEQTIVEIKAKLSASAT